MDENFGPTNNMKFITNIFYRRFLDEIDLFKR